MIYDGTIWSDSPWWRTMSVADSPSHQSCCCGGMSYVGVTKNSPCNSQGNIFVLWRKYFEMRTFSQCSSFLCKVIYRVRCRVIHPHAGWEGGWSIADMTADRFPGIVDCGQRTWPSSNLIPNPRMSICGHSWCGGTLCCLPRQSTGAESKLSLYVDCRHSLQCVGHQFSLSTLHFLPCLKSLALRSHSMGPAHVNFSWSNGIEFTISLGLHLQENLNATMYLHLV